jgi:hypothetical protein
MEDKLHFSLGTQGMELRPSSQTYRVKILTDDQALL